MSGIRMIDGMIRWFGRSRTVGGTTGATNDIPVIPAFAGTSLTNEEWTVLEPLLPVPTGSGRPRRYSLREIMNGIRYVLRYGIPWDAMPKDLPPSSICYDYWRLLSDGGHMERINHHLVMADREKAGRGASPTLAIIDAQSVKCDAPQGERGYDAGKKVLGRKRHIAVDSGGRLLAVAITPANVQSLPPRKRGIRTAASRWSSDWSAFARGSRPWLSMAATRRFLSRPCRRPQIGSSR